MKPFILILTFSFFGTFSFAQNHIRKDSLSVSFAYNQSEILDPEKLLSHLEKIDGFPLTKIKLIGYTDSTGSLARNKSLAAERIRAVSAVLEKSHLKRVKIEAVNANETSGWRLVPDELNRRVDIFVYAAEELPKQPTTIAFKLNKPVNLNVNFKGGTAIFLTSSYPNLELLKKTMLEDTTLYLKLQGHVCCDNDYKLSVLRAYAVAEYLTKNGIDNNRMLSEGFSNSRPLVPDNSEENMSLNRRVEAIFYRKTGPDSQ